MDGRQEGHESHDHCVEAVKAVYQYLDGEMHVEEQVTVTAHLRRCRGCADAVEFEKAFLLRIKMACPESAPTELLDRVRGLLRSTDEQSREV